jgi:subtilisin family serine protease
LAASVTLLPRVAEADSAGVLVPREVLDDLKDGSADVIIQLVPEARHEGDALAIEIGEPGAEVLPELGVVTATVDPDQLAELTSSDVVAIIEPDQWLSPQLDRSTARVGARTAWSGGYRGAGRSVAIIDSGVDATHPALAGKVVHEACFTRESCPNGTSAQVGPGSAVPCRVAPTCEHGTHVAGIAGGRDPLYNGVAPDAQIVAVQVFSFTNNPADCPGRAVPCTRARTSDVLAGLDHLLTLPPSLNLVAANLSLSSDSVLANCDQSILAAAVNRLKTVGVATIAASGNGGFRTGLGVPACISSTISVGATFPDRDALWSQTNWFSSLDLLAPGVGIVSPGAGGTFSGTTGTSAAAPHVTGAWAIVAQRLGTNDVDRILTHLRHSGVPVANPAAGGAVKPRVDLSGLAGDLQPASYNSTPLASGACRSERFTSGDGNYVVWQCTELNGVQHWSAVRNNVDIVLDVWAWSDARLAVAASPVAGSRERQLLVCQNRTSRTTSQAPSPFEGRWQRYNAFDTAGGFVANVGVDNNFTVTAVGPDAQPGCIVQRLF